MALMPQFEGLNTPLYQSAPTSPHGDSPSNLQFYSAPSSPGKGGEREDLGPHLDDFEFETSKKFSNFMEFEVSENFECLLVEKQKQEKPKRERGGSLPTMAFADELFANGLVMPLKPPPRFQSRDDERSFGNQGSIPSSPRSPSPAFRNPFVRRVAWDDDFDPFVVALKKVSEGNRGRSSSAGNHHKRTRSHSPFRTSNKELCNDDYGKWIQESAHLETPQNSPLNMRKDLKGSPYARWVIDQTKQIEQITPKGRTMLRGFTFVKRVRPVKADLEGSTKAISGQKIGDRLQDEGINSVGKTKMKRIKRILQRYASFRRENNEEKSSNQNSRTWGSSYLKKLSFKMKGNATSEGGKKRAVVEEPKMAVVEYKRNKPNLALCFYGIESPRTIGRTN